LLSASLPPCRRFSPRRSDSPYQPDYGASCCLRPTVAGSASGATHFRGHLCVHFRCGPVTRTILKMCLSMGFRSLISLLPAIQATRLLVLTWVGLVPTERASLRWTHNSTCIIQTLAIIIFDTRPTLQAIGIGLVVAFSLLASKYIVCPER